VLIKPLSVIPPSKFEGEHIEKLLHKMTRKRGLFRKKLLEDVTRKSMVWMPYYKIQFSYSRRGGRTERGETALNAMLCEAVKTDEELLMLFRPNYLKYETMSHFPRSKELVGPTVPTDFDSLFGRILERLNRVRDELNALRSELSKRRVRIRRYSVIVPMMGELKKEKRLSERVAMLSAMKNVMRMCLNVNREINSIKATSNSVFYYPTLVVTLKNREDGTETYLVVDLVARGVLSKHSSFDRGLTKLCNKNEMCGKIITSSFPQ